jgi:hypothetical protein
MVAATQEQHERAARLFGAAAIWREAESGRLPANEVAGLKRDVAATRAALGVESFAAAWEKGRAMTLEHAMAYAMQEGSDA